MRDGVAAAGDLVTGALCARCSRPRGAKNDVAVGAPAGDPDGEEGGGQEDGDSVDDDGATS
jgi:hypothetical protein